MLHWREYQVNVLKPITVKACAIRILTHMTILILYIFSSNINSIYEQLFFQNALSVNPKEIEVAIALSISEIIFLEKYSSQVDSIHIYSYVEKALFLNIIIKLGIDIARPSFGMALIAFWKKKKKKSSSYFLFKY